MDVLYFNIINEISLPFANESNKYKDLCKWVVFIGY